MRASQILLSTLKEIPADAEIISHKLMLKAGLINRLASGLYTWLPIGLRVLRKVETIVREEMDRSGAQELIMPVVQPSELWQESLRWQEYGPELLRVQDRHQRDFCLGPTHEEVITDIVRNQVSSYRQLPQNFYQIQTKFRDEVRPRFGVMRSREFIMKDAYSFHIDAESLGETYQVMYDTYCRIFDRIGLDYRAVLADTGSIGGKYSHEFHVLADSGEDEIAYSNGSDYAANIELAEAIPSLKEEVKPAEPAKLEEIATPGAHTIDKLCKQLGVDASQTLKTLIVQSDLEDQDVIALVVRGDHKLNRIKAEKIEGVATPLAFASEAQVLSACGCKVGSIGPVGLNCKIIVDGSAATMNEFVCGANKDGYHLKNANWQRDVGAINIVDIRDVVPGDPSPCGQGQLQIRRGIEVGHIFQLGTKYSEAMGADVLDESGKKVSMAMGCYGIGITRIVAAAIEQNHDSAGIIWPDAIAPFDLALIPINAHKSDLVQRTCERLYTQLQQQGYSILYMDEPKARLGSMLADVELLGIPHRLVIGERGIQQNELEYRGRTDQANTGVHPDQLLSFLSDKINR